MAGTNWNDVLRGKGNTLGGKNKPQANSRRPKPIKTLEEEALELKLKRLESLKLLQNKFNSLQINFKEPNYLDFQPNNNIDDLDNLKLAFTSNNAPFLAFEDSLTRLLIELDGVESGGEEEIRNSRKHLVREIEAELEHLEGIKKEAFLKSSSSKCEVIEGEEEKVEKVDNLPTKTNGTLGKDLPSIPNSEDKTTKINGGSLKRTDVEERRGSPVSGAKEFAEASSKEDRYSKVRRQDTNTVPVVSNNDLPLFARLPSRFD